VILGTGTVNDQLYDPLAPDVIADPYPFYRRLRETHPVYRHEVLDSWVVTGYADCREVLADPAHYASDFRRVGAAVPAAQLSIQALDPPEHTAIRHLLVTALHEQPLRAMADHVRAVVAHRCALLADRPGVVDLVPGLVRPVALSTICRFLGVEPPDGASFEELSNAIVWSMDAGLDPSRAEPGDRARGELSALIAGWLRDPDGPGFLGAAERARRGQPAITVDLLANSLRAVLHAGYESASRLLGASLLRLAGQADLVSALSTPDGTESLVDELIRLDGPVQADARVCVTDRHLGSRRLRRGDVVLLFLAAANRDPAVFADPDRVDLGRQRGLHLALGRGAHSCLGASLASLELRILLESLDRAGLRFRLAGSPVWEATATLRGLASLPVTVTGARPATPFEPIASAEMTGQQP
jgi:cytochrome P450